MLYQVVIVCSLRRGVNFSRVCSCNKGWECDISRFFHLVEQRSNEVELEKVPVGPVSQSSSSTNIEDLKSQSLIVMSSIKN
jgi:hypothetical protein